MFLFSLRKIKTLRSKKVNLTNLVGLVLVVGLAARHDKLFFSESKKVFVVVFSNKLSRDKLEVYSAFLFETTIHRSGKERTT